MRPGRPLTDVSDRRCRVPTALDKAQVLPRSALPSLPTESFSATFHKPSTSPSLSLPPPRSFSLTLVFERVRCSPLGYRRPNCLIRSLLTGKTVVRQRQAHYAIPLKSPGSLQVSTSSLSLVQVADKCSSWCWCASWHIFHLGLWQCDMPPFWHLHRQRSVATH